MSEPVKDAPQTFEEAKARDHDQAIIDLNFDVRRLRADLEEVRRELEALERVVQSRTEHLA